MADEHSEKRRGARAVLSQLPPEDVPALIDEIRANAGTDDSTARYQWLFIAQGGWLAASTEQRDEWRPLLEAARQSAGPENPRTLELIGRYN